MAEENEVPHSSMPQCLYLSKGTGMTSPYVLAEPLWSVESHLQWARQMFITAAQTGFRTGHLALFP